MSLTPAFEIGLWNAWVLVLPYLLIVYGLSFLIADRESPLLSGWPPYTQKEKRVLGIVMVSYYALWIYSIFLPLDVGAAWFYVGFPIYLLGIVFVTMGVVNFATTPLDEPVTKGIFRISRNPMYLGFTLVYIGVGLACASWIALVVAMVSVILWPILITPEGRFCPEKYGDAYREYMKKAPRYIGVPKGIKGEERDELKWQQ